MHDTYSLFGIASVVVLDFISTIQIPVICPPVCTCPIFDTNQNNTSHGDFAQLLLIALYLGGGLVVLWQAIVVIVAVAVVSASRYMVVCALECY